MKLPSFGSRSPLHSTAPATLAPAATAPAVLALAALGAALLPAAAQAQSAAPAAPVAAPSAPAAPATASSAANPDTVVLDPLEVTEAPLAPAPAYRVTQSAATGFRAQPVLDTPFSVAGFSADFARDIQARSLLDLTRNDPSITPANDPLWYDRVYVRGFYLGVDAVFRDGLAINDQGSIALENKEAVEITKGLSATRYGVTSPGGTLNYMLKRPLASPLTSVTTFADGFGGFGASADLSRRFGANDRFGARVNVAAEEIRSYIDAVEGDRTFVSAAFDWRVSERLLLEAEVERQDKELTSAPTLALWSFPDIATARALFPRLDGEKRPVQSWASEPNVQTYVSGRATYAFSDDWRLRTAVQRSLLERSQTAIYAENIQPNGDYDRFVYHAPDQERENTAWQVVLEGDFETGALRHELAVGFDFTRRDMVYGNDFYDQVGTDNLFNPVAIPRPATPTGPVYLAARSNQHSLFLTDTVHVGERWQVFGGARLTRLQTFDGAPAGLTESYDKQVVNPTAALVFKPVPKLSLYASYAEGIEQGGTAPVGTTNAGAVLPPLESSQIEAGAKLELPRGALLTLAAFRIDKGLEYRNAANTFVQDGRQIHDGVELTLAGPVTEKLRVVAGLAWLDAAIDKTADPADVGLRPQGVAEWQANLYADYDLGDLLRGLSLNAGLYYTGEKPIDFENTWMADSYVRLDAGLRYRHRIGETTTATWRLGVENVTDELYLAESGGSLGFGAPRTVKLSATFDF
jgi:iron complex outermembrane receptor protein